MRFLLAGHTVKDIIKLSGKEIRKPGGLFYSIITAINLSDDNDELILLTEADEQFFNDNFLNLPRINKNFISISNAMPTVILTLYKDKERDESYKNLTDKINIRDVLNFAASIDGIYVNMITGFELTAAEILTLKEKFQAPVYIDIHSLARGIDKENKRYFRPIPQIDSWLNAVDLVQANENEIKTIYPSHNELEIVDFTLSHNVKALIKTEGKKGARIYFKHRGEISSAFVTALKVNSTNQVGCGDSFGVSFFYSYICNQDLISSLIFANKAAGFVSTFNNFNEFEKLKNVLGKRNH